MRQCNHVLHAYRTLSNAPLRGGATGSSQTESMEMESVPDCVSLRNENTFSPAFSS